MGKDTHILVPASGKVHHQYVTGWECGSKAQGFCHGVGAFEGGQNALSARESNHRIECGGIILRNVLGAA
jgi:hypothetical protein